MNTLTAKSLTRERPGLSSAVTAMLGAALLGGVILFGVGFSSMNVAHNAAHDMRHANGFPCH
jgi:cobalt transporter subunit CbtB